MYLSNLHINTYSGYCSLLNFVFISLAAMFEVKVLGHSFVHHLALYSVEHKSLNFNLDEDKFQVTFVARGGLKVPQMYSFTTEVMLTSM